MYQKPTLASRLGVVTLCITLNSCIENPTKPSQTRNDNTAPNYTVAKNPEASISDESISVLASTAVDKECKKIVVKTTVEENIAGLAKFTGDLAKIKIVGTLSAAANGTSSNAENLDSSEIKQLLWYYSKNYVWLPISAERIYGDRQHEDYYASKVLPRNEKNTKEYTYADSLLQKVLAAVEEKYDYEFQLFIIKEPGQNAISLPGGRVYLDRELVKDQKLQDRAIFAIAHEVSHVLQRHQTKHIQTKLMDSVDLIDIASKIKSVQTENNAAFIIGTLLTGKQLFTRNYIDQEMQADACGVKLTAKAMNGDKHRLTKILQAFISGLAKPVSVSNSSVAKINQNSGQSANDSLEKSLQSLSQLAELVSSPIEQHPTTKERENNLVAMIANLSLKGAFHENQKSIDQSEQPIAIKKPQKSKRKKLAYPKIGHVGPF